MAPRFKSRTSEKVPGSYRKDTYRNWVLVQRGAESFQTPPAFNNLEAIWYDVSARRNDKPCEHDCHMLHRPLLEFDVWDAPRDIPGGAWENYPGGPGLGDDQYSGHYSRWAMRSSTKTDESVEGFERPLARATLMPETDRLIDFCVAFANKMENPITEKMSLVNSLLEWKDFRRIAALVKDRWRGYKTLARAHLTVEFGIVPLISDAHALLGAVQALKQRMEILRRSKSKPITVVHEETWEDSSGHAAGEPPLYYSSWLGYESTATIRRRANAKFTLRGEARVTLDTYGMSEVELQIKSFLRYFGLANPLKILWNAIPFSFMVDWVLGLSNKLDKLDMSRFRVVSVAKCTTHYRAESKVNTWLYYRGGGPTLRVENPYVVHSRTYYRRWVGFPLTGYEYAQALKIPSSRQLALAVSLWIANRRPKRW